MNRAEEPSGAALRRQYALATAMFAVLVLATIFLFGHLLSRSLSRRYLQDALISGREQAQTVADALGGSGTRELQVVERRREELVRTLAGLPQRRILESIEVTNRDGEVVFTSNFSSTEAVPEELASHLEVSGGLSDQDVGETEQAYRISVPLGEVGEVVVKLSKGKLAERAAYLRRELMQQTLVVAGVTLLTMVLAFVLIWHLIQRTRKLEEQRHEASEMAALGVLAANLAHEIRNPLNSINLNLELLQEDLAGSGGAAASSLVSTRQEVGRLARLVSDFMTYARPAAPRLETVRVGALLREVAEFLRGEARRQNVHLRLRPDLADAEVRCDTAQVRQVLLNLVLNAVQSVSVLEADRRVVELGADQVGDAVRVIVHDRGMGIPGDELERVRQPFVSLRRGGTGLGLAIAERIVAAHDGRLELENVDGGFEAAVVLPVEEHGVKMGEAQAAGRAVRRTAAVQP
jgi:signal transduction histidine kinase